MEKKIYTKAEIRYNKKDDCYVITTWHKEGAWEGSSSGARLYKVAGMLVHTSWGNGKPINIYMDLSHAKDFLETAYGCIVEIITK